MGFVYEKGFTHGGVFHADDVFSTAFLKSLNPEIVIERGFSVPENYDGIIFDIGGGEFDHHQKEKECRENGCPYAAFGKLWRAFAPDLYSEYVVRTVDKELIESIDASDNGVEINALADAISTLNPNWDSDENAEDCFENAVTLAGQFLSAKIKQVQSQECASEIVKEALTSAKDGIVVLPRFCPWKQFVMEDPDAKFVIFPSLRGGYNIQTVPTEENPLVGRVLFPEEWLGNSVPELGITFCHQGNFLACTNTLEQAINVARIMAGVE